MHLNCHPTEVSLPWCWSSLLAGPAALDEYVSRTSHRSPALSYTVQTGHSLSRVTLASVSRAPSPSFVFGGTCIVGSSSPPRIKGKKGVVARGLWTTNSRGGKKEKSFEIPCASLVFSSFEERKKRSVKEKEKKRRKMFKQRKEENDSKSRRVSKEPLRIIGGSCSYVVFLYTRTLWSRLGSRNRVEIRSIDW